MQSFGFGLSYAKRCRLTPRRPNSILIMLFLVLVDVDSIYFDYF